MDFTGTAFATVSAGIQVSDSNRQLFWQTTQDITFDALGDATGITASCTTRGANSANAGTLTVLITPNVDINTVTNPEAAVVGDNEETDNSLRRRRDLSTYAPSIGLVGSLYSSLSAVPEVTFARVYNNITMSTDANGIPAKSVACVVVGGDDEEIAQTIFQRISAGVSYDGNTNITFVDNQNFEYTVSFWRPTSIPIYVEVNLSLIEGDVFPDDGVQSIKDAIVAYSLEGAAGLGITQGFDNVGFPPGQDVILSRLYTPINSVPGHEITSLLIGTNPAALAASDIAIAFNEVSDFQVINIEVNIA